MLSNGSVTAESTTSKCKLLNCHFAKVFSNSNLERTYNPPELNPPPPELSNVSCSKDEVLNLLSSIPRKTSSGLMVSLAPCLVTQPQPLPPPSPSCLTDLCHLGRSLLTGNSQISHLYQKVVTPNLLLSLPSKILERIIYNRLLSHLLANSLLSNSQFGFRPCSSTQEALIAATTGWHQYLNEKQYFLIFQKLLIRFSTRVFSELLLELVSPAHCTPGLLTICLVTHSMLSLMVTPHRSPKFPLVSRKVQF